MVSRRRSVGGEEGAGAAGWPGVGRVAAVDCRQARGAQLEAQPVKALSLDKQTSPGLSAVTDWEQGSGRLGGCQRGVTVGEIGGSGGGGYVAGKQQ